jgi:hypothetical protein
MPQYLDIDRLEAIDPREFREVFIVVVNPSSLYRRVGGRARPRPRQGNTR